MCVLADDRASTEDGPRNARGTTDATGPAEERGSHRGQHRDACSTVLAGRQGEDICVDPVYFQRNPKGTTYASSPYIFSGSPRGQHMRPCRIFSADPQEDNICEDPVNFQGNPNGTTYATHQYVFRGSSSAVHVRDRMRSSLVSTHREISYTHYY